MGAHFDYEGLSDARTTPEWPTLAEILGASIDGYVEGRYNVSQVGEIDRLAAAKGQQYIFNGPEENHGDLARWPAGGGSITANH